MSVRFTVVKTALETKCRQPGGKRIKQALADASAKLDTLAPETLLLIDAGLAEISLIVSESGDARPAERDLSRMLKLADELAGYCAVVRLPGLDKAFIRLCQLADAVMHSDYWRADTFGPTLVVLRLTRQGALTEPQLALLFEGIDQCTEKYMAHRLLDEMQRKSSTTH